MYRCISTEFWSIFNKEIEDFTNDLNDVDYFIFERLDNNVIVGLFNIEDKKQCSYFIRQGDKVTYVPSGKVNIVDTTKNGDYTININDEFWVNIYPKYGCVFYHHILIDFSISVTPINNTKKISDAYISDVIGRFKIILNEVKNFDNPIFVRYTEFDPAIVEDGGYYYDVEGSRVMCLDCATEYRGFLLYRKHDYLEKTKISPIGKVEEGVRLLLNENFLIVRNDEIKSWFVLNKRSDKFFILYDGMFDGLGDLDVHKPKSFLIKAYIDKIGNTLSKMYYGE